jgi:hypothetical protein
MFRMVSQEATVRFQVLTAASMKMTQFRFVAARSLAEIYRRFKSAYCLHHHGVRIRFEDLFSQWISGHDINKSCCHVGNIIGTN